MAQKGKWKVRFMENQLNLDGFRQEASRRAWKVKRDLKSVGGDEPRTSHQDKYRLRGEPLESAPGGQRHQHLSLMTLTKHGRRG